VPRALPERLAARLDPSTWRMPSIVRLIGALGGLDDGELRATFNGGLGMIAVVDPAAVPVTLAAVAAEGVAAAVVGEVGPGDGGPRYVEGPLSS
jgi:phosphoribosylformylglycinamidine cyclo-ligase